MVEYIIGIPVAYFIVRASLKTTNRYIHSKLPKLRATIKGRRGEQKSQRLLSKLDPKVYQPLHDLLLPAKHDTSQLDHVLVSPYGLFVIETKAFSGIISGREWDTNWVQHIPRKVQELKIPNPCRQNYGHRISLQRLLTKFGNIPIHSIIAVSDSCQLDVESYGAVVVNHKDLLKTIDTLSTRRVLSDQEIKQIKEILQDANIPGRAARKEHIKNVKLNLETEIPDSLREAYEAGKNSPIISFTRKPTESELAFQNKVRAFLDVGPIIRIAGKEQYLYHVMKLARRNEDGTVSDPDKPCHHIVCPFTGDTFPETDSTTLLRGLWATYFNQNPDISRLASTRDGMQELFPRRNIHSAIVGAYVRSPEAFTKILKETAWYKNIESHSRRPSVDRQIHNAQSREGAVNQSTSYYSPRINR